MGLKICFIWTEKFRNFENFGFNLDSAIKFSFDQEKSKINKINTNSSIKNFFGNDVSEVTGVIGKNGTGKSNLLELVCKLVKGGKTSVDSDFLIITKNRGQFECHHRFKNDKKFNANFDIFFKKYVGDIDNLKTIYFSNVYDERIHSFSSKVSDLSANKRYRRHSWPTRKTSDFVKQLQFVRSEAFIDSEIPSPLKVVIVPKLNVLNNNSHVNRMKSLIFGEDFDKELRTFVVDVNNLKPSKQKLYYLLLVSIIIETITFVSDKWNETLDIFDPIRLKTRFTLDKIDKIKLTYKSKADISRLWAEWCDDIFHLKEFEQLIIKSKKVNELKEFERIKGVVELLQKYDEFLLDKDIQLNVEGTGKRKSENYILNFNKSNTKLDVNIYNYFDWSNKFKLDWLGLSSGQKAYLDIFSLLRFELKNIKADNVLICIDEGDLYLHPKWQADFFYKLIKLIPMFKKANYQFVLSSHSPFLVSDLPKSNLTFLGDDSENYSQAIYQDDNIQTFGGNLGELYINAFFMEGSLISRFAASKIQNLVDKVNAKEKLNNDDEKLINSIGDDIIRVQLQKLRNDKN